MTPKVRETAHDSLARGTFTLMAAQVVFVVGAYFIHFFLGRVLGPAEYGVFGVVMAYLVWLEVSLTGGMPFAIRKFGAEREELMPAIARAAMRAQAPYAMILFIGGLASAPLLARLLHDPGLAAPIAIASLDIPIFAFYFCYTAILNGKRRYSKQSAAMLAYAAAKVGCILLLVAMGLGVTGALIGNILASVAGLATAVILTGSLPKAEPYPVRKLISFAGGTAALSILYTLLITIDLLAVKALLQEARSTGYFTAAATLARAPFYVLVGIAGAALPAMSRAASMEDDGLLRRYIRQAVRLQLILLAPITALFAGAAPGILRLLYSTEYAPAASALAVLAVSWMFFGILHTIYSISLATGDTRLPVLGSIVLIATAVLLNIMLIPRMGIIGAAAASTLTGVFGLVTTGVISIRRVGTLTEPVTVVRIALAAAPVYFIGRLTDMQGIGLVALCMALIALYALILVVVGEITMTDVQKALSAIGITKQRG